MREFFSALWSAAASLIGMAVFLGLMLWAARSHSTMWRRLAARYAGPRRKRAVATKLETWVIAERGLEGPLAFRQYAGLQLALHVDGISAWLVAIPPLNLACRPLFLPFAEMDVADTDWMLWTDPAALRMRRTPALDIVIGRDTLRWIREHIDVPPFRPAP